MTPLESRIATASEIVRALPPGWSGRLWTRMRDLPDRYIVRVYLQRGDMRMGYVSVYVDGSVRWSLQGDDYYHREVDAVQMRFFRHADI